MAKHLVSVALLVLPISAFAAAPEPPVEFPVDAVIDMTKLPYGIIGDGKTDCTEGIHKALTAFKGGGGGPDAALYFPPGVYVVSDTLALQGAQKRTVFQGAGREHTTIRLKDKCPGFTDPSKPKPVFWFGNDPAQRFRNHMFDLTVHTGSGNGGAVGVQYYTSNQGAMMRVDIVSGDGEGVAGLDTGYKGQIGPGLVRHLRVSGFRVGITCRALNSMTMEHLTLENQKKVGLFNRGHMLAVRGLTSRNSVPAVRNNGVMTLVDAVLDGGKNGDAIINGGGMFARNVRRSGYARTIVNATKDKAASPGVEGPEVKEWTSRPAAGTGAGPHRSLNLMVKETPTVARDPADKWVSPLAFGAVGDGRTDDTAAIQKAIDSGATTVYLPRYRDGKLMSFAIKGDLRLHGKLKRFYGCDGPLNGEGRLIVEDADGPLVIERVDLLYRKISVVNRASRPVVLSNITFGSKPAGDEAELVSEGSGDLFMDDICVGHAVFGKAGQRVWMRQINTESPEENLVSRGAHLWILGHKTERGGIKIDARGGSVELLGGFAYCTTKAAKKSFVRAVDADVSVAGLLQIAFGNPLYDAYVSGTRQGKAFAYTRRDAGNTVILYDASVGR
jgi:hypothetical protein